MKKYVRSNFNAELTNSMTWTLGNTRFSIHMNDCDEDQPICKFSASEIHPYDMAEYTWARCTGDSVDYYRNMRKVAHKSVLLYDDEDYEEYHEYVYELVDSVCRTLRDYNRDVEPQIDRT